MSGPRLCARGLLAVVLADGDAAPGVGAVSEGGVLEGFEGRLEAGVEVGFEEVAPRDRACGTVDAFKQQFAQAATTRSGSGWAWLVLAPPTASR